MHAPWTFNRYDGLEPAAIGCYSEGFENPDKTDVRRVSAPAAHTASVEQTKSP